MSVSAVRCFIQALTNVKRESAGKRVDKNVTKMCSMSVTPSHETENETTLMQPSTSRQEETQRDCQSTLKYHCPVEDSDALMAHPTQSQSMWGGVCVPVAVESTSVCPSKIVVSEHHEYHVHGS
jgi:hypothetical protein